MIKILILSFIEGITEFLPISSTTHLLIAEHFLKTGFINDSFFMVLIQLGSLFALLLYYKTDISEIFKNTLALKKEGYIVIFNLLNAFIASAFLGLTLKHSFDFQNNYKVTFYAMIGVGILMILIGKKEKTGMIDGLHRIGTLNAFFIGVLQVFSMIPGVSRLGITVLGGLFFNLTKQNAIRFSFLLGLPTMFCASFFEFGKLIWKNEIQISNIKYYAASFFFSLIISLVLIKFLMKILHKTPMKFFGYYRIIFAALIAFLFLI
jgi:undecaprenyl-diphosphatase